MRLNRLEKAREFRKQLDATRFAIQKLVRIDDLSEEELDNIVMIYESFTELIGKTIPKGYLLRHDGVLYKSLKEHEVKKEFNPVVTNYLYVEASPKGVIPEWVMPTGYQNAYDIGDKVIYIPDGKIYISKIEGNSQEPTKDEPHNRYWEEFVE